MSDARRGEADSGRRCDAVGAAHLFEERVGARPLAHVHVVRLALKPYDEVKGFDARPRLAAGPSVHGAHDGAGRLEGSPDGSGGVCRRLQWEQQALTGRGLLCLDV